MFSGALVLFGSSACRSEPRPAPAPPVDAALATEEPLELVPAAGLRWLLFGRPRDLLQNEAFCGACSRLVSKQRLAAFAASTGIELRSTTSGLIAGYDLATVYGVTSLEPIADAAVAAFRDHLRDGGRISRPRARLQRVSGIAGETPEALVTVGDRVALVTVGDLTLARVIEAFALGKLARSPPALRGAALTQLAPPPAEAIAALYVPGPFIGEWTRAAHGLLGGVTALSITLVPAGKGAGRFHLIASGDFPADASDHLSAAWSEITSSTTGRVLGLDRPLEPPAIRSTSERLELEIRLETAAIANGLHAVLSAEAWQILNLPAPTPL